MDLVDIKAYVIGKRVLVQYFDSGKGDSLVCPDCTWIGKGVSEDALQQPTSQELRCPCCGTALGMVSSRIDSAPELAGFF